MTRISRLVEAMLLSDRNNLETEIKEETGNSVFDIRRHFRENGRIDNDQSIVSLDRGISVASDA